MIKNGNRLYKTVIFFTKIRSCILNFAVIQNFFITTAVSTHETNVNKIFASFKYLKKNSKTNKITVL